MLREYTKTRQVEIDSTCYVDQDRSKYTNGSPLYTVGLHVCIATVFYADFNSSGREGFLSHHQPMKFVDHSALTEINNFMTLARGKTPVSEPTGLVFANKGYFDSDKTYRKLVKTIKSSMEVSYTCSNGLHGRAERKMRPVEIILYRMPLYFVLFSPNDGTWTTNQHGTNRF